MLQPDLVDRPNILQASKRIAKHIRVTPTLPLESHAFAIDASLTLKLELFQVSGSFKARGAFNRILCAESTAAGVIAASGGNHGAAVAYAARALTMRAEIFVPTTSAAVKIRRLREYGAHVTVIGDTYADALTASRERARETGALEVHAFDHCDVIAGAATMALEFERQVPALDTIVVAVGGGGLIAGVASWYDERVKIVAAESEGCPTLHAALEAGEPVDVVTGGLAADSLGARRVGAIAFKMLQKTGVSSVLVPDVAIAQAQVALWDSVRVLAEPGGATALAALLCGAYTPSPGERVGVVVCGGNVSPATYAPADQA
ncbi:MAG: threonine/serine dehydratase [Candidatus Eremiobacteraeota bacterium]|nr:threonine/serine dehydratase [Candidatus Eremiobacteraeota bacterium]